MIWAAAFAFAGATPDTSASLRQVVGILDYVGADYAEAVDTSGRLLDEAEYQEQVGLTDQAVVLTSTAGVTAEDPAAIAIAAVRDAVADRASPAEVLEACRSARRLLAEGHDLVLEPAVAPDRARARDLWVAAGCASCHGERGDAETPVARTLDPPPADFLDPERVAKTSPYRAFHALTHGVPGTAMSPYDSLTAADRWSLAFYVLSLRHVGADADRGRMLFERAGSPIAPTPSRLSQLTEEDLLALFPALTPADRTQVLAWLRVEAPFAATAGGQFSLARRELAEGARAYRAGDAAGASRAFVAAYLDGIEPFEPSIEARAPTSVRALEDDLSALRGLASAAAPADDVDEQVARVLSHLDAAEERPVASATATVAAAATIAVREGVEMALLVSALLAYARAAGSRSLGRAVHLGWVAAVLAGLGTWFVAGHLIAGLAREVAEGAVALLAAAVLLGVTHWIVGQATARTFMGSIAGRMREASGRGAHLTLASLSFAAVYREAFEVVLFYRALLLEPGVGPGGIGVGIGIGLAVLLVVAVGLGALGRRLSPRPLMLASSAVLAVLVVVLVGKGIHAFQEAGLVPFHPLAGGALPALGIYPTYETFLAQASLAALLVASALPLVWRRRNAPRGV